MACRPTWLGRRDLTGHPRGDAVSSVTGRLSRDVGVTYYQEHFSVRELIDSRVIELSRFKEVNLIIISGGYGKRLFLIVRGFVPDSTSPAFPIVRGSVPDSTLEPFSIVRSLWITLGTAARLRCSR